MTKRSRRKTPNNEIRDTLVATEKAVYAAVTAALRAKAPRDIFTQLVRAWGDIAYAAFVDPHDRPMFAIANASQALGRWEIWKSQRR